MPQKPNNLNQTIDPVTRLPVSRSYLMGGYRYIVAITGKMDYPEAMQAALSKRHRMLPDGIGKSKLFVGVYNGCCMVSVLCRDLEMARAIGVQFNQKSIYDWIKGEEVTLRAKSRWTMESRVAQADASRRQGDCPDGSRRNQNGCV